MRTSNLDMRVMIGTDIYSNHNLVRIKTTWLELRGRRNKGRGLTYKATSKEIRMRYNADAKNSFGDMNNPEEEYQ